MNKLVITLTAALGLTMSAQANIGDSKDQALTRYGRPVDHNDKGALIYEKNGWRIIQGYNESDVCFIVSYIRLDGNVINQKQGNDIDTANFAEIPVTWTYQHWSDQQGFKNEETYFDRVSGKQIVFGFIYEDDKGWCAFRTLVNNKLWPQTDKAAPAATIPL
jgi:hypothetical protein